MQEVTQVHNLAVVATFHTDGKGFWSTKIAEVMITRIHLEGMNKKYGELQVYFNTDTWDIETDGLIYTDKTFLAELKAFLTAQGFDCSDLDYSEQGMQGYDYVSLDTGANFNASYFKRFGV